MSNSTPAVPGGVVLDWTRARTGAPELCVFGDGPTVCRSPVKDVPCHKACAETWITTHARDTADRQRLVRVYTPRAGGAR